MRFATARRCCWPCFLASVLLPLSDLLPPPAAGSKAPKSLKSGANDKIRTCGLLPARPDQAPQAHARRRGSAVGAGWSKSFGEQGWSILCECRSAVVPATRMARKLDPPNPKFNQGLHLRPKLRDLRAGECPGNSTDQTGDAKIVDTAHTSGVPAVHD